MSASTNNLAINPMTLSYSPSGVSTVTINGNSTCPITLSNITYLQTYSGTFTPANNQLSLVTAGSVQPNILYCVFDQPMAITMQDAIENVVLSLPIQKSALMTLCTMTYPVTNFFLEGRSAQQITTAVQQGVACNYFILMASATIT